MGPSFDKDFPLFLKSPVSSNTIIAGSQVTLQPVPPDPDKSGSSGSGHLSGDKLKVHNFTFDHAYWSHNPGDANFITQDRVFTGSDDSITKQEPVSNQFKTYGILTYHLNALP